MKYTYIIAATLLSGMTLLSSCEDKFAGVNTDPTTVSVPDVRYLFATCALSFQPANYDQWFYGFPYLAAWTQASVLSGGNTSQSNVATGSGCGYQVNTVLKYTNDIKYYIGLMSEEDKGKYGYIQYLCTPLCVFLGLEDSDMYGSRQYSEAMQIRYGGTLTPKFDTQEELFDLWLKELDEAIAYLSSHTQITDQLGSQDIIFKGNVTKWAKFANSLKLKIAARLLNVNRQRAIDIVNETVQSPVGLLTSREDDFIMNKGKENNNFNNDPHLNYANEKWVDFMKENHDPRLFYFYMKNDYNSNVIQAFFDQDRGQYIPSYIMENVEYKEVDGKKVFTGWKGMGEPWVRYYGIPCQNDAKDKEEFAEYFDSRDEAFFLYHPKTEAKVSYVPTVRWNKFFIKGKYKYYFPDKPSVHQTVNTTDYAWYGLYFSAAEVNLLLAEFKLLGANVPGSAQEYLLAGVEQSVRSYDHVASLNHLPYYDAGYTNDPFDKTINTTEQMIADMLACDAYKLDGSQIENLEKVYIQQMIHYTMLPMDMFVTCRRSGVPMKNSKILPREDFDPAAGDRFIVPRRFAVGVPSETEKLYDVTIAAYEAQGYTYEGSMANAPVTLAKERIWYDKDAPEYGAGPNVY
ncbi:SusD/RagB family nutrient-binding outer membrane lipoprotein [Parabacteroides sp.]